MDDTATNSAHAQELARGERFAFGRNWRRFLATIDESRISRAQQALVAALDRESLEDLRFLDAGCGSGLSALAALRAGAEVTAFDYDPEAVAATRALLTRFAPRGSRWEVLEGSVLDRTFVLGLGPHDIVHSWGVLHHTGAMWEACGIVADAVPPGGTLYVALYNDAGEKSVAWTRRKRRYVRLPRGIRTLYAWALIGAGEAIMLARSLRAGSPGAWVRRWRDDVPDRGMDRYRDWIDWIGGYPYEYADKDSVLRFFGGTGLDGHAVSVNDGTGCSEFVFARPPA